MYWCCNVRGCLFIAHRIRVEFTKIYFTFPHCRSQWPSGLKRRSVAPRLLGLWVRIPPGGIDVCRECFVLSGRGLCDEPSRGVLPTVVRRCV